MPRRSPRDDRHAPGEDQVLGGLESAAAKSIPALGEVRLLRAREELAVLLRDSADPDKAARLAARFAGSLFHADHRCLALLRPGAKEASVVFTGPGEPGPDSWPAAALAAFARGERPDLPESVAVARLKRRGRAWGVIGLRWKNSPPDWTVRNALTRLAAVANEAIERTEGRRLSDVRARIERKIMEQLRPKDLFYQILDGLRSLTAYDHSGSILLRIDDSWSFELVAEQLAFRKGRSHRIGARLPMDEPLRRAISQGRAWLYSYDGGRWEPWTNDAPPDLPAWLHTGLPPAHPGQTAAPDSPHAAPIETPAEAEVICVPLAGVDAPAGILKVASLHHGTFGPHEADLLAALAPHAMIALQNARRAESLEDRMIQAERKHAMAELARGVSHDINNALGSVLPLVQQLREEVDEGRVNPSTLAEDLAQIEQSLRTCGRIFGGMLQFARRAAHESGAPGANIETALDAALNILGDGLARNGIEVHRDFAPELPLLPLRQTELEQVLLNLVGNARDAMSAAGRGGNLSIHGACRPGANSAQRLFRFHVQDDGVGIPAESLQRVLEPFYTTKPAGNGLGLAICRSIIWQCQGRIHVESPAAVAPNQRRPGARVVIEIPLPEGRA